MRRPRFTIRWLMAAVLIVGLICGGLARWSARQFRRQGRIAQLHLQQEVTDSVIQQTYADISATGRKKFWVVTENSSSLDAWRERLWAYGIPEGARMPLIFVEMSGGCDDDLLRPITIKTSGASLEGRLVDRLVHAYRAQGWPHEVVPGPAADK